MSAPPTHRGRRPAAAVAALSLAGLAALVLYLAGRPLDTSDLWFHLAAGEAYVAEGPWPDADPLLHTAHEDAPVQHEWLFGVAVHLVERALGFHGLRVAHALAVAGILALVFSLFRRESASLAAACLGTSVFAVLAWWRLVQLRPHLVSIAAAFLVYRLLLEPDRPPSWKRVAAAAGIFGVWANVHSIFAAGLALLVAALAGTAVRAWLAWRAPGGEARAAESRTRLLRLAAALALSLVVTLANPRGLQQHLTFFTSSQETAIWAIVDEWSPFTPLAFAHYGPWVSPLAWLVTDLLLVAFLATALVAGIRLVWRPTLARLHRIDPVRMALGGAAFVAILVSVRFFWMAVFPLLFLLRAAEPARARRWPGRAEAVLAAGCALLLVGFERVGEFHAVERSVPRSVSHYLETSWLGTNVHPAGVRFLRETGLEGNLFNGYTDGGFLGYWLAPRMRTFIDGRTEHYPPEVWRDYMAVVAAQGAQPGETFLDVLDRRNVDVFFGVGLPQVREGPGSLYTTAHLEDAPGWRLVFRTVDESLYLREGERNRENRARVAAFYAREGVPFDPERGLDVAEVLRQRPDWAVAWRMAPVDHAWLLAALDDPDRRVRFAARNGLGLARALVGAYREQVVADEEATGLVPRAAAPRRRLVFGWLHLGRPREALLAARELTALDPNDPRSALFERVALHYATGGGDLARPGDRAILHGLPLLDLEEAQRSLGGRFARVPVEGPLPEPVPVEPAS